MSGKKLSFTLSEILITLTIIGILAVILIPQTVGTVSTEASKVKFRNTYIQLQQAFNSALQVDGVSFLSITKMAHTASSDNERTNVDDFVRKYLGGVPVTRSDSDNSGLSVTNGSGMDAYATVVRSYKLPNGAHLLIPASTQTVIEDTTGNGCVEPRRNQSTTSLCVAYVDINGAKSPNQSLGTILKGSSTGTFSGIDVTGACTAAEGSAYSVVFDINHFCEMPENINFDIYPVLLVNNGLRPYSNVISQVVNGKSVVVTGGNSNPNVIMQEQVIDKMHEDIK